MLLGFMIFTQVSFLLVVFNFQHAEVKDLLNSDCSRALDLYSGPIKQHLECCIVKFRLWKKYIDKLITTGLEARMTGESL